MLDQIKDTIKEYYYDKTFHGIDLDAKFKAVAEKIKKMDTNRQIDRAIAQLVLEFNDSHTTYYPPGRANSVVYGFSIQMIGYDCFIVDLEKGSDAEAKGLKIGDVVVAIGNYTPTRENLWKINYLIYRLDPQETIKVYVLDPGRPDKEIEVKAKFKSIDERRKEAFKQSKKKQDDPYKCKTIACRLETFSVDRRYIDMMMNEVGSHKKMILDLRGNGGGYVRMLEYLAGYFFDKDVKISDMVERRKTTESKARSKKGDAFKGELVVLIDSNSASASEVFSRLIQLEKRGKVVGDASAGKVMTSIFASLASSRGVPGYETISLFGVSVTVADLIMSDGKRLENVGVIPDYAVGPTGKGLREKNDPVLAFAAALLNADISSEAAGRFEFRPKVFENDEDEGGSKDK
jgi:carboxyl-terminal processing protease